MWAAVRGGVGVACRTGGRQYWPTPWPSAVVAAVRVAGWCAGWRSLPLVSVRRAGGRSVAGVRPWPWWPFSWPLAAFRPSAGPLVRRGPFVARGGPFLGLASGGPSRPLLAGVLAFQSVVFRRRLRPSPLVCGAGACVPFAPSVVAVAVSLAVLAGVAGVGVIAPCRGPWSVSLAASMGRRVVVCWWCHCAVPCWVVCRGRPSVLVSAVAVAGRPSVLAGVLVCGRWLAVVSCRFPCPWRPFRAVGGVGVRRWSLRPVWAVFWALPTGWPCGPCQWWRRWWLAVLALAVVLAYFKERRPVAGWRWAVCGAFRGGGVRLPCLWSLLVSRQRRPWPSV